MSDETDNLVLRLLQEIRAKLDRHDQSFDMINERMTGMERHMEDVKESVTYAFGFSAHANVAYETTGRRLDRVAGLQGRIETLETTK